jgi:hypothetical protein
MVREEFMSFDEQEKLEQIKHSNQLKIEQFKDGSARDLEQIKRSNQLSIEEFKDRRAAISDLIKENINLERYVLIGIVAYYAWLLTHCIPRGIAYGIAWFIPVLVPVLGIWRRWENIERVWHSAYYTREIEHQLDNRGQPIGPHSGWEHFLWREIRGVTAPPQTLTNWRRVFQIERSTSGFIFWIILLAFALILFAISLATPLSCEPSVML